MKMDLYNGAGKTEALLNNTIVHNLRTAVTSRMTDAKVKAFINKLVKDIINKEGIELTTVLRRDHDGNSQADYLVEKMIGEFLKDGQVNY